MKKILVLLVVLLMVGCEAKDTEKPKQIIEKAVKQEQQVEEPKEEVKEEPKEEPKQVEKEPTKKEKQKKKEQNDNIDPETGLANVKDGTHLEEEAKKQEEEGIIEPEEDYNEPDYDDDWLIEYGNTEEFGDYDDYSGEYE